ncbi:MAG: prephenate dehydrogenase/arogenate dehydrogenase family protein [Pseudomonadota bacterium]
MKPDSIAIVGGLGRMGRLFTRVITEAGIPVAIADVASGPIEWGAVAEHQVTVLAVPIPALEDTVGRLGPFTRPDGLVLDLASVKVKPVEAMLRHCRGEVIGTHPLFGPAVASLRGEVVFMCPARTSMWRPWVAAFFEGLGVRLMETDPERHDRLMAAVQVLRHLLLLSFGRSLMKMDFNLEEDLPVSGRWFSELTTMLQHQCRQPQGLYADIRLHNPFSRQAAASLLEAVSELVAEPTSAADKEGLIRLMDQVSAYVSRIGPSD